mmetsp:Transcript_17924/g.41136  ORF Transcript_17924/g.41136 Transcript_17924/m.41136 type:complete len:94 (+) Transcript_17924:528-809(+)
MTARTRTVRVRMELACKETMLMDCDFWNGFVPMSVRAVASSSFVKVPFTAFQKQIDATNAGISFGTTETLGKSIYIATIRVGLAYRKTMIQNK